MSERGTQLLPFPRNFIRRERWGGGEKLKKRQRQRLTRMAVAVQWSSAPTSLNRWCRRPSPAVSVSPVSPPRWAKRIRKSGVGGRVPVRGELAVAAAAAAAAEAEQTALQGVNEAGVEEEGVECEGCSGAGWLLCDFCKGKKNNVKSEGSPRIYRRCPTCKAAGYVLCSRCRVYRCITYPDTNES